MYEKNAPVLLKLFETLHTAVVCLPFETNFKYVISLFQVIEIKDRYFD